jgi:hypothetical protein
MSAKGDQLLSAELLSVAAALRSVRSKLCALIAAGTWPEGTFADMSTVQVYGPVVAEALERLAKGSEPAPRTPTHLDERR